ncbi:MAG: haloacid dehalogenase type II [Actinomycetota bacterium]|nr:haloacid dehalogenase type II [Actinomycetota bacterium]
MALAGIAFDAFGTLFDLQALRPRVEESVPERGAEVFDAFVDRLVPSTWHATVSGRYRPLPEIAAMSLRGAAAELGVGMSRENAEELAGGLVELPAFGDAAQALDELADTPLAVLSNGTEDGIARLVDNAGLAGRFDHLLAADAVRRFKPARQVYALAPRAFGAAVHEVMLVSGNEWDAAGAKIASLRTAWIARGRNLSRFLDLAPDVVADELADLPEAIRRFERQGG